MGSFLSQVLPDAHSDYVRRSGLEGIISQADGLLFMDGNYIEVLCEREDDAAEVLGAWCSYCGLAIGLHLQDSVNVV